MDADAVYKAKSIYTHTTSTHVSLSHVCIMCRWRSRQSWLTPGGGASILHPSLGRAWPAWWHHLGPGRDAATSWVTSFDGSATSSNIPGHDRCTGPRISSSGGREDGRGCGHTLRGVRLFNWLGELTQNCIIICWTESPLSIDTVKVMLVQYVTKRLLHNYAERWLLVQVLFVVWTIIDQETVADLGRFLGFHGIPPPLLGLDLVLRRSVDRLNHSYCTCKWNSPFWLKN